MEGKEEREEGISKEEKKMRHGTHRALYATASHLNHVTGLVMDVQLHHLIAIRSIKVE